MTSGSGSNLTIMQRRHPERALAVNIGTILQKELGDLDVTVTRCDCARNGMNSKIVKCEVLLGLSNI
jgi:hypothetical protein